MVIVFFFGLIVNSSKESVLPPLLPRSKAPTSVPIARTETGSPFCNFLLIFPSPAPNTPLATE